MAVWKLVAGILTIVFGVFCLGQSVIVTSANAALQTGDPNGVLGMLVGALMIAGGIVSIATRKAGKAGCIAVIVILGIAAWMAFQNAANFPDMKLWGGWNVICVLVAWFDAARHAVRKAKETPEQYLGFRNNDDEEE